MKNVLRGIIELTDPFIWPLLVIALGADLLIVDAGRTISIGLGGDWIHTQKSLAPFARNVTLLIVALAVLVKVPQLLFGAAHGRLTTKRLLVFFSLCAVGVAVLHATDQARHWLLAQDIIWILAAAVTSWAVLRSHGRPLTRAVTIIFLLSLTLPRIWRSLMQLNWSASSLNTLQELSDVAPILVGAAIAFTSPLRRNAATITAGVIGAGFVWALLKHGFATRKVLEPSTGLLLAGLPPSVTAIIIGLMAFAFGRLLLESLRADALTHWRLGLILCVFAKITPDRPEQLIGSFLAFIPLSMWASQSKMAQRL